MLTIRLINNEEIDDALVLVFKVFMDYDSKFYTPEGIEEFYKSINDKEYVNALSIYGAFLDDELVGVIATRNNGNHIAMFFVDGNHHKQGIGKQLFKAVQKDKMTVNSSPYAVDIYQKLGFKPTDTEQIVNGLRFTPMQLQKIKG